MAMPSTGAIGMVSCPNGVCSSIAGVVCGSLSGPISLCSMFQQTGQSIPGNMINFHGSTIGDLSITPTLTTSIPALGGSYATCLWSATPNTVNVVSSDGSWLVPFSPSVGPNPTYPGYATSLCVCTNAGAARSGTITYTPIHCGSAQVATFCQLAGTVWKCVNLGTCTTIGVGTARRAYQYATNIISTPLSTGECYRVCAAYNGSCSITTGSVLLYILAGGTVVLNCTVAIPCVSSSISFVICPSQTFYFCVDASKGAQAGVPRGYIGITSIVSIVGSECLGTGGYYVCAYTCSA
jgi:hypothetical protein